MRPEFVWLLVIPVVAALGYIAACLAIGRGMIAWGSDDKASDGTTPQRTGVSEFLHKAVTNACDSVTKPIVLKFKSVPIIDESVARWSDRQGDSIVRHTRTTTIYDMSNVRTHTVSLAPRQGLFHPFVVGAACGLWIPVWIVTTLVVAICGLLLLGLPLALLGYLFPRLWPAVAALVPVVVVGCLVVSSLIAPLAGSRGGLLLSGHAGIHEGAGSQGQGWNNQADEDRRPLRMGHVCKVAEMMRPGPAGS